MIVLEVLGVGIWAVIGVAGAWALVTGRKMMFDLPRGIQEGWLLRVLGLLYLVMASYLIYEAFRGSFSPEGVVFTYVIAGIALAVALNRRRRART